MILKNKGKEYPEMFPLIPCPVLVMLFSDYFSKKGCSV
jgi:hypothetical protein